MLHPLIKWAQRKDKIFIEVPLMDITNQKIDLTSTHLTFEGTSGQKKYGFTLQLLEQVNTELSKWNKTGFHFLIVLEKSNTNSSFWTRLVKPKQKNQYIQVDWAKWVDQDQEVQDPTKGLGNFDPSQMQNFGGLGQPADQDDQEQGNLDDLQKQQEIQGKKNQEEAPTKQSI